jgi:hypothetical protein
MPQSKAVYHRRILRDEPIANARPIEKRLIAVEI